MPADAGASCESGFWGGRPSDLEIAAGKDFLSKSERAIRVDRVCPYPLRYLIALRFLNKIGKKNLQPMKTGGGDME